MTDSLRIQRQIMENTRSINDYFKDLYDWELETKKKDKIISNTKIPSKSILDSIDQKTDLHNTNNKLENFKKLKRDVNSIADYYREWDKVDVDEELADIKSDVMINSEKNESEMKKQLFNSKSSNAKANTNILIKSNRFVEKNFDDFEKMKNEANANFAIGNYNKSIEMNIAIIKLLENKNIDGINMFRAQIFNNKGNSLMKLGNYKEAIDDFNQVIKYDTNNIKAYFRRGICFLNLKKYNLGLNDLLVAKNISPENEKNNFDEYINKCLSEVNSIVEIQRKNMQNFEWSENVRFKKVKINEIDITQYIKTTIDEEEKNSKLMLPIEPSIKNKKTKNFSEPNSILKPEDVKKFVYDVTSSSLTGSTFKYAFRNFKNNQTEKEEYLLKIDPSLMPKIFSNDLDKDILYQILECLNGISKREDSYSHQLIPSYLRSLAKINRFKLVIKLLSKKDRTVVNEIFDNLRIDESELIPLKDYFL